MAPPESTADAAHTVPLEVASALGTKPSLAAPTSDRCGSCGTPLAADQRYCVECGERRGAARFSLPAPVPVRPTERVRASRRRGPVIGASGALIAGVATLLLAMGVGVLIGNSGKSSSASAGSTPPVQVVTVGGGAAVKSNAASTASHKSSKSSKSKSKSKAPAATAATPKPTVKNLPPPTVTVGAKGHGPGFQNGKFTGHFFGP
jgi:hypothetical protein